jgi:hypothetical protein
MEKIIDSQRVYFSPFSKREKFRQSIITDFFAINLVFILMAINFLL